MKDELEKYTKKMFRKYKLKGWRFEYSEKMGKGVISGVRDMSERIIFNPLYIDHINDLEKLQNCVLHEIGHILSGCTGHNKEFRKVCKEIGCRYNKRFISSIDKELKLLDKI